MNEDAGGWQLTEHACARCLGRVLRRGDIFLCAVCEAEATGTVEAVCCCGLRPADRRPAPGGFRCVAAPAPQPGQPRVVVRFGADEDESERLAA